jgi:hypothetical protein
VVVDVRGPVAPGGEGERKVSPLGGPCDLRLTEAPVGPLQSSQTGALQLAHLLDADPVPCPSQGVQFNVCCRCGSACRPTAVPLGSFSDGLIDNGDLCEPCLELGLSEDRELAARQGRALEADEPSHHSIAEAGKAFLISLGLWSLPGGFWVVLFIPWLLLGGCQEEEERDFEVSPAGYYVSFAGYGGAPVAEVPELYRLFDESVTRAAGELYRYGVDPATTESVAHGTGFLLIDHIRFQVPDGRWATGANFGKEIWVALHRRQSLPAGSPFPADALPWTCFIGSAGDTRFGVWTPSDTYPALGHEIGHTIYGATFEHTWTPPIVNPSRSIGTLVQIECHLGDVEVAR